jgi:hypothetical protein
VFFPKSLRSFAFHEDGEDPLEVLLVQDQQPVGGELPIAPQKTPERTRDCGNSARPKSVLSQASLGNEDTPSVQLVDVPRGTGAWFEPTSHAGHAAIGV